MKKIAIASLALFASLAFAGSVTLEGQDQLGDKGAKNSTNYQLTVKESINNTFAADVGFTNYQQNKTEALSTRLETGVTGSFPVGPVGVYTRVAVGEKYTSKINIVTSDEKEFVFSCKQQFDLIMSDADHMRTDQWFEYVYDALLADDGILCYHDVTLTSMFPNLINIVHKCQELNLRHKVFNKDSLSTEMCFRGFLVIFK